MKQRIIGLIISIIFAIIFWTVVISYVAYVGFHTELQGIQNVIVVLLTIMAYLATATVGVFIGLLLVHDLI